MFVYREIGPGRIDEVRPLWERQREFHVLCTAYFADDVRRRTFVGRKEELLGKARPDGLSVDVCYRAADDGAAGDEAAERAVGYCVSSVTADGVGEIESLYVHDDFRRHGIATELVRRTIVWLERQQPTKIIVVALAENVAATEFYKRFGLMPRAVVSELVRGPDAAH
ncbi:MAG: GNAT family N-acetyltransferase [Pirellulales bacterium]